MSLKNNRLNKVMMYLIVRSTPSCEVIAQKISLSIDQKISLLERIQIRIHILTCKFCERYRDQLLGLQKMIAKYSGDIINDPEITQACLSNEANQRIKQTLEAQSGQ